MLALLPLLAPLLAALAPGDVVLGVSSLEGTTTEVRIGDRVVATIAHAAGELPAGVVVDGALYATVPTGRGRAHIERIALDGSGAATVLAERATPRQPPIVLADGAVVFVRAPPLAPARAPSGDRAADAAGASTAAASGALDVVVARGGQEEIVAALAGAWLTPLRGAASTPAAGAPLRFLRIAVDGRGAVVSVDLDTGAARVLHDLGRGPFHSPCGAGAFSDLILVERAGSAAGAGSTVGVDAAAGRASTAAAAAAPASATATATATKGHHVVDARTGRALASAKHPGLSPACGDGAVAWSTGRKDGTVTFVTVDGATRDRTMYGAGGGGAIGDGIDGAVDGTRGDATTGGAIGGATTGTRGDAATGGTPDGAVTATRATTLRYGRAGVARPQAAAVVNGAPIVVAHLDRGAALPPETWVVDAAGPRLLATGGAVAVFGIAR